MPLDFASVCSPLLRWAAAAGELVCPRSVVVGAQGVPTTAFTASALHLDSTGNASTLPALTTVPLGMDT